MSGGHFDYKQYSILSITEDIRETLKQTAKDLSPEMIAEMCGLHNMLLDAYARTHRVHLFLSDDIGETDALDENAYTCGEKIGIADYLDCRPNETAS